MKPAHVCTLWFMSFIMRILINIIVSLLYKYFCVNKKTLYMYFLTLYLSGLVFLSKRILLKLHASRKNLRSKVRCPLET
jgi:hypothetical protein